MHEQPMTHAACAAPRVAVSPERDHSHGAIHGVDAIPRSKKTWEDEGDDGNDVDESAASRESEVQLYVAGVLRLFGWPT